MQAARLCIGVYGYNLKEKKKSKSKKEDRKDREEESNAPLHWVNMQILDHK